MSIRLVEEGWRARCRTGNARRVAVVEQGVMVKGTVFPGLIYSLQGRSFG
ncbi:hypothetical protein AB0P02_30870 [Streptomyces griseoluteus]